jgi:hypothetical protein
MAPATLATVVTLQKLSLIYSIRAVWYFAEVMEPIKDLCQFSRSVLGTETKTYGPLFNHNYDQTQQANGTITVTGFPMLSFLLHVPQTTANSCIPAAEIAALVVSHIGIP